MRKINVSIVVGVIVAVLGAGLVIAYGHSVNKRITSGKHPVAVLVADDAIPAGTLAKDVAKRVHVEQVPSAFVVTGAMDSTASLNQLSAGSVLTGAVPRGGQISRDAFTDAATAGRVVASPGHVAISVETDLSPGVARYLSVGSLVDVFATYHDVRDSNGKLTQASSRTKLFATGIKVLAVCVAQDKSNGSSSSDAATLNDKVVVLLDMAPTDAEKLVNATTLGEIYLAQSQSGHDVTSTGAVPTDVTSNH